MRVRMVTRYAGPDGVWQPGAVVDLPEGQAMELVAGGYAEAAEKAAKAPAPVETTEGRKAPERAVSKRGRAKRPAPKMTKKGVEDG